MFSKNAFISMSLLISYFKNIVKNINLLNCSVKVTTFTHHPYSITVVPITVVPFFREAAMIGQFHNYKCY